MVDFYDLYRINYGNGQVSDPYGSRKKVFEHLEREDKYAFVERRSRGYADEPGEWFRVKKTEKEKRREW